MRFETETKIQLPQPILKNSSKGLSHNKFLKRSIGDWSPPSFWSHLKPISTKGGRPEADYAQLIMMSPPSFESHSLPYHRVKI